MFKLVTAFLCAFTLAAAPVWAKDHPDKGKGPHRDDRGPQKIIHKDDHRYDHDRGRHDDNDVIVVIDTGDQRIIHDYYREHRPHCPPGLAKKNPDCMPPGQYKKYHRGDILPDAVILHPLPHDLLVRLHPAPHGARYVMVDQNVYLISEASRKILDAVVLLSAVQ